MKLVFLGPPGAGKGTQAAKISKKYGLAHISTGDILRAEIKKGSELGKMAHSFIEKGELVPDNVIVGIVQNRIAQPDCAAGFLLDGFPRTIAQAKALEGKVQIDCVIDIDVPESALVDRICGRRVCPDCGEPYHIGQFADGQEMVCECGAKLIQREDDKEETVRNRLRVYKEQTEPLIDYYRSILSHVDGTKHIDEVFKEICKVLEMFAS